jgi:hypothetical protein
MLAAVEDAQLEGVLMNKEEAISFVKKHYPRSEVSR